MPDSTPVRSVVDVPRSSWTGRLEFDLLNGRGWRVATAEMVIRIDDITVWCGNRTLAVMDRERFGEWLLHPGASLFEIDDIAWSVREPYVCITIDGSMSYPVPHETVQHLLGVV
jgi:hypothetical protein